MDATFVSLGAMQQALHVVTNYTPTTGQTIAAPDNSTDGTLYITPAGTLAALTVTFPTNANSRIGQLLEISSTQSITTLTLSGATMLDTITSIDANECYAFRKVSSNTWIREL